MAASEQEVDFWDRPPPTSNTVPNPFSGTLPSFQPVAGIYPNALVTFEQPLRTIIIASQEHYNTLVKNGEIHPPFLGPLAPTYLWGLTRPEPLALPSDWAPFGDPNDPQQRTIYYDCVTKISTYSKPKMHGDRAWAGIYGPPQPPLQPAVVQYGQAPRLTDRIPGPYGPGQHLEPPVPGTLIHPKSLTSQASSGRLHPPNQPTSGSGINPGTIAAQTSQGNLNLPNRLQGVQDNASQGVQINGAMPKKKKGLLLLDDGVTKGVMATDYTGKQEFRAIRPPADRAASRYMGFASNQHDEKNHSRSVRSASTFGVVTNPYKETGDVDRTPRPSDFKGKTGRNTHINVSGPNPAPGEIAQAYKPGLHAEIQRRLHDLEMDIGRSAKQLLPKEVRQLVVENLRAGIMADLQDPYKQDKKERQRNVDLLQVLEFAEAEKFIGEHKMEYKLSSMPNAELNKRVAMYDADAQRVLKGKQDKQEKHNQLQMTAVAYANGNKNELLKNLKHAHPSDIYHSKHAPKTPPRQLAASNDDNSSIVFYTQERQFLRTPPRGQVGGTQMAQYQKPSITSPTGSDWSCDDVQQTIVPYNTHEVAKKYGNMFKTAALKDDVFTDSRPCTSYSSATAYSKRELTEDELVDGMIEAQRAADLAADLAADAAAAAKSYARPSNSVSNYFGAITGGIDAMALAKAQPFEKGTRPSAMPSGLAVREYAKQRRSSALNVGNLSKSTDVMLKVPKQLDLRRQPSLLFGSIADALSAAESIRSEQGVWKPVDQLPLAISDRAHYPSHTDDDSFDKTPVQVGPPQSSWQISKAAQPPAPIPTSHEANRANDSKQYKHASGASGRTASHENKLAYPDAVIEDYKTCDGPRCKKPSVPHIDANNHCKDLSVVSEGSTTFEDSPQQTSVPHPDANNYYKDPSGRGKTGCINVATGKQITRLPAAGEIVPVPKLVFEGEKPANSAVDLFVERYTKITAKAKAEKEKEKEKEEAAKAADNKAKNYRRPNQRAAKKNGQDMSFLTVGGPLPGGWKAVSDSGHNTFTSRPTLAAPHVPSTASADPPRHNPSSQTATRFPPISGPGQQQFGQSTGFGNHYPQHGPGVVYDNPQCIVPWPKTTSYNHFGTHQQQYGFQQHFAGSYGNGMAGGQGCGNQYYSFAGTMIPGNNNNMGGRVGGGAPEGGQGGPYQGQEIGPGPHPIACGVGPNFRNFTYTGPYGRR